MGILLGITAALMLSIFFILLRVLSTKGIKTEIIAGYFQTIAGVLALLAIPFMGWRFEVNLENVLWTSLSIIIWVAVSIFNVKANQYLEASINIVLSQTGLITIYLGSLFLFGEQFHVLRGIGVAVILFGNVLLVLDKKLVQAKINKKGLIFRLVGSFLFALGVLVDVRNVKYNDFASISSYTAIVYLVPGLILLFASRTAPSKILKIGWEIRNLMLPAGVLVLVAYYLYLLSLGYLDSGVAAVINGLSSIFVSVLGIYILKEKDNKLRKLIAACVAFGGIVLLSI